MADDIVARLRDLKNAMNECGFTGISAVTNAAADEIEQLRKERDEARWEVCGFHHLTGFLAGDYAISRGWDYFNDERKWPKFPPSVTDFKEFLKGQDQLWLDRVDRLTRERDEARRLWCVEIGELYSSSPLSLAKERGWDCFKENRP